MPRINWGKKYPEIIKYLHDGNSVRGTAKGVGIGYSTLCKFLREASLTPEGVFKERMRKSERLKHFIENYVLAEYDHIQNICKILKLSEHQLQYYIKEFKLNKEWDFKNSTSKNIAVGRKAELFIKNMDDFRVLRDPIKKNSKSPYDLILQHYGGTDVKATKLRETKSGGYRFKFNVGSATNKRNVKYVFALGYNEDYTQEIALFIIPTKDIRGKKSISISWHKLEDSKYFKYLHKIFSIRYGKLVQT